MSFMFNPYPYDDNTAVNRPGIPTEITDSVVSGTVESSAYLSRVLLGKLGKGNNIVVAMDGYTGARFDQAINIVSQNLKMSSVAVETYDFGSVFKPADQLDGLLAEYLEEDREKDPVLLYGRLFKGGYEELLDSEKRSCFEQYLKEFRAANDNSVLIVSGQGCTIKDLRQYYDCVCYFDIAPKEAILRARRGMYANVGDTVARPVRELLRRCYYVDFEVAVHLRRNLIESGSIDYYIASTDLNNMQLMPWKSFRAIMSALVKYPMRCKPVYLEGVWGGYYIKKLRNLPDTMRNCAWVFDMIPLEVSILVEAGTKLLEFPFFTFVQTEGVSLMGQQCVDTFGGYFPIRFNYDDSYHSNGNMSIQVHSGHKYNIENYSEHGRQDESYYVVVTGHDAKTYVGFNEGINPDDFVAEVKKSEKEYTPVDYEKYVNYVDSLPGTQVMLPAGTIHSSGRNQVVLEIGSLTIGSYTYKMYDYLRADLDGKPRPIHTYHGERVLEKDRKAAWVKKNLVQEPKLVRQGDKWAEYIVGEHELLYFSLRRLEFEKSIEDNTNGKFHVLNLVDGERVIVRSLDNPERCYTQNYLDMIIVPADMGRYTVENLGNQPVCIHKTMLKDGFADEELFSN